MQNCGRNILANISAGSNDQTQYIVDNNAIPILIDGVKENMTVLVQANSFQALGNIVSNTEKCRDLVLAHDIIKHMKIAVNAKKTDDFLLEDIAWCLGNLYRINEHNSSSPASKWDDLTIDVFSGWLGFWKL